MCDIMYSWIRWPTEIDENQNTLSTFCHKQLPSKIKKNQIQKLYIECLRWECHIDKYVVECHIDKYLVETKCFGTIKGIMIIQLL